MKLSRKRLMEVAGLLEDTSSMDNMRGTMGTLPAAELAKVILDDLIDTNLYDRNDPGYNDAVAQIVQTLTDNGLKEIAGIEDVLTSEGLFSRSLGKRDIEDLVNKLKVQFQIAYETGLESPGTYDDFDREFWNNKKQDLISAFEEALK